MQIVTGLDRPRLEKIVDEVRAWYARDLRTWVRARHRELQRSGFRNPEIFARIRQEARGILVRPAPLSERQIRRIVYG
ncbi:MAG: hypothetical protein GF330_14050 [Candidatus Eisenbacteria bacterium]|nr:hypothetical protein [Candidatus Eisenbacteria bacterium]